MKVISEQKITIVFDASERNILERIMNGFTENKVKEFVEKNNLDFNEANSFIHELWNNLRYK